MNVLLYRLDAINPSPSYVASELCEYQIKKKRCHMPTES